MMCQFERCGEKNGRAICCCQNCDQKVYSDDPENCFAECILPTTYLTQLTPADYLWQCRACDWTLRATTSEPVEHRCGRKEVVRLGDRVEAALSAVGITQEKWLDAKETIGLPRTCNCAARKDWLNALDDKLGLGTNLNAFMKTMGWK
jgi:hypothetical protein